MKSSQLLEQLCETYRTLLSNKQDIRAKQLKTTRIPAFAPCAFLYGGKSRKDVIGLTGYGMIDIDHITKYKIRKAFEKLQDDPHTVLAVRSVSNLGIHIIFRYEFTNIDIPQRINVRSKNLNRTYKAVITTAMAYYEELLGLQPDKQWTNMERTMILSHDPNLIYHPEAAAFRGVYSHRKFILV